MSGITPRRRKISRYDDYMPMKTAQDSVVLAMDRANGDVRLITSILEKAGFQVWTSSEEANVLSLCHSAEISVRLVIIDTAAPGIHTFELLESLRQINPGIGVLLLAGEDEPKASHTWTANVRGQLSRPFRRAHLLGSVLDATAPALTRTA
jgi:DNA-binding NtrC family response regulator